MFSKKTWLAAIVGLTCSWAAHAADVAGGDLTASGPIASPGVLDTSFSAAAGPATLSFDLLGYNTLDGANDGGYSDWFHLVVNGTEVLTGSFALGGQGQDQLSFDPNGASVSVTDNGFGLGGNAQIALPVALVAGNNTIEWSYSSDIHQGLGDEGWGVGAWNVSAPVPEPASTPMMLAGLAALGLVARRRSARRG